MRPPLRAAVVGASGFGRFHAQWYAREGAELVGYVCTSEASVQTAKGPVFELSGQEPRGYDDVTRMLEAERPDLVSVCTPLDCHLAPTLATLTAGAHVLCEKPIAFESGLTASENLAMADRMVATAEATGRVLAVNLQYAAALDPYLSLFERSRGAFDFPESYEFSMESKGNRHGPRRGEALWIDLGPHALTPLMILCPESVPDPSSIRVSSGETEIVADLDFVAPDGRLTHASLRTAACASDAVPVRRFGFDGFVVDVVGRRDAAGVPKMGLAPSGGNSEVVVDDLMQTGIRRFLNAARGEGEPLVSGNDARRNMEAALQILEKIRAFRKGTTA